MAGGLSYDADEALLASIAVDPALQSKGIGGKLVDQFLVQAKAKGARTVYLATQALNNENINRFYQRKGFSCRRIVLMPEDRQMNEYWRPI
jgi:N-acetylglutamate synthase-like GNAT family acetyltransferase